MRQNYLLLLNCIVVNLIPVMVNLKEGLYELHTWLNVEASNDAKLFCHLYVFSL